MVQRPDDPTWICHKMDYSNAGTETSLDGALFWKYLKFLIGLGYYDQYPDENVLLDGTYMLKTLMILIVCFGAILIAILYKFRTRKIDE